MTTGPGTPGLRSSAGGPFSVFPPPVAGYWLRPSEGRPALTGLRATLPIGRVVGPAHVVALAVHIMTNAALTGATYDIDGGQQFTA